MNLNVNELSRKYRLVQPSPKRLHLVVEPNKLGNQAHLQDGIWHVNPAYLEKAREDVLQALNINKDSKEAKIIKHRTIINPQEMTIEFFLPWEIKI